jgi:hypothetical protein
VNNFRNRKQKYASAIDRATSWILSHQREDGGFGDVESLTHYMVLPAALLYLGHPGAAARLMPFLKEIYLKPNGDWDFPPADAKPGHLAEAKYGPAWMTFSAHVNLAFDMSLPTMPFLLAYQHPETGGVFGRPDHAEAGSGILHVLVTPCVGQAAIATGYLDEARGMGDFLTDRLIAGNPDLNHSFYPIWDTERGLRTDDEAPVAPNMPLVLRRDAPDQHHFVTGFMLSFLTDLYRATSERKYLDGALAMYEFAAGGTDAVYRHTASHKFCWGCTSLYRETGDARHLESACLIADFLVDEAQDADGSMVHYSFIDTSENWPYSPRLNITAQFALWIQKTMDLL